MAPRSVVLEAWLKIDVLSQPQMDFVQKLYHKDDGTARPTVRPLNGPVTSTEKASTANRSPQGKKTGEEWLEFVASEMIERVKRRVEDVLTNNWEDYDLRVMTGEVTLLTHHTNIEIFTKADLDEFLENDSALCTSGPVRAANITTLAAAEGLASD